MSEKAKGFIKGVNLTTLGIAAVLLIAAAIGKSIVVANTTALIVGIILAINSVIETVELFLVDATGHERLYTGLKVASLIASVLGAIFLLTNFVKDPTTAIWTAIVILVLNTVFDGAEAFFI